MHMVPNGLKNKLEKCRPPLLLCHKNNRVARAHKFLERNFCLRIASFRNVLCSHSCDTKSQPPPSRRDSLLVPADAQGLHLWDRVGLSVSSALMALVLGRIELKRVPGVPEFIDKFVDHGEARGGSAGKNGSVDKGQRGATFQRIRKGGRPSPLWESSPLHPCQASPHLHSVPTSLLEAT